MSVTNLVASQGARKIASRLVASSAALSIAACSGNGLGNSQPTYDASTGLNGAREVEANAHVKAHIVTPDVGMFNGCAVSLIWNGAEEVVFQRIQPICKGNQAVSVADNDRLDKAFDGLAADKTAVANAEAAENAARRAFANAAAAARSTRHDDGGTFDKTKNCIVHHITYTPASPDKIAAATAAKEAEAKARAELLAANDKLGADQGDFNKLAITRVPSGQTMDAPVVYVGDPVLFGNAFTKSLDIARTAIGFGSDVAGGYAGIVFSNAAAAGKLAPKENITQNGGGASAVASPTVTSTNTVSPTITTTSQGGSATASPVTNVSPNINVTAEGGKGGSSTATSSSQSSAWQSQSQSQKTNVKNVNINNNTDKITLSPLPPPKKHGCGCPDDNLPAIPTSSKAATPAAAAAVPM